MNRRAERGRGRVVYSTTVAGIATHGIMRENVGDMNAKNNTGDGSPPTELATLLRQLREDLGVSMYELAKRTDINRSTLMRIEDGTTTQPDAGTLNTLARALSVDPELFYDAVWQDAETPLPSPSVYFRSKYRLTPEQITELEASLKRVTEQPTNDKNNDNEISERRSP
jgi:transcriptional regulator with XRE-family HTH domain